MITGIALLLIACAAMTVLDFTNNNSRQTKLQDILDAATLAAARVGGDDDEAIKQAGDDYLKAHLPEGVYKHLVVTFTPDDKTVRATATADIDPYFLNMFMGGPVDIAVDSEVTRQMDGSLEVALVLDVTLSMAGSKIDALQDAAEALVKKITKVKDADVKVGVVPFSNYVNVGVSNRNEPWVSGAADKVWTTTTPEGCHPDVTQSTYCVKWAPNYSCTKYNDGVPYQTTCSGACTQTKTDYYDPPKKGSCWKESTTTHTAKWSGCVGSPAYPGNVQDKASNVYPAKFGSCAPELAPLTDKLGPVESAIKSLKAGGNTYIPGGLAWGWNLLSPTAPFTEAAAYDPKNKKPRKALVLMTDGANTMYVDASGNHVYVGDGKPAPQADKYTAELCENIKKQKIEVYTVAFQIDIPSAHEMLAKCATSPGHYFKADSSEELLAAFEAIAKSLENLRITR
ncbi:pilus assembly protein TadG-related protein [Phenylobacterium sp.]|uniref:pilus assembly protein TadG-related protein n=1 Tax=Phenylobacterium sp. TaxID=1871053 RepID=UPI002E315484|nr:pilus assembly protein TadG-related protein [Phenylobacterium sp.]HEX2559935.1 pilus assembly protein TadG-related protein [Phenylobacterium sp.]